MMNNTRSIFFAFFTAAAFLVSACGGGNDNTAQDTGEPVAGEWVVVHELSDPEGLNPIVTNDASASAIFNRVYERLIDQNFETTEIEPVLAEARPIISEDHLRYTFTLKQGIHFSDGTPITTKDVLFSFKAVKNPLIIDAAPLRNYYIDVKDIEIADDRTFSVVMSQPYFLAEWQLGSMWIMSKKHLDPKGLSDGFTIAQTNDIDGATKNPGMKAFAEWFNSAEVKRDPKLNIGSGPYVFDEWNTGEAVIIKRNDNWWNKNPDKYNPAYPGKIIYKVVNDRNTAVVALKNQEIDFMEYVPPPKYTEEVDTTTMTHLAKHAYEGQVYTYIGWNTNRTVLADKRTRRALSHLVDRDALIKQVVRGIAVPLNSPVYPQLKEYDKTIPAIQYDQAKARTLLTEAGWTDSNNDGILDRMVDGKRVDFTFKFLLNAGNEAREQIMLILADEFKKVGIKVEIQKLEWSVFLENLRTRNFDAYVGSWVNDPIPTDPYQLWHSSQTMNNGSNYTGFSNARADQLIEMNRTEFDEAKRIEYMKEFQRIVVEEQPYTFLWMPLYPSVYNKRLHNVNYSLVRPGYNPSQWWVAKSQWRLAAAP
jgi:peptide/nickel transport system substrate-binding protein